MGELKKNIDIVREMRDCIRLIEETMDRFGDYQGLLLDNDYRAAAAFNIVRMNALRKWFSLGFRLAHPQLDKKMDIRKPGGTKPDVVMLWDVLQNEIPRRKAALVSILDNYGLVTSQAVNRDLWLSAKKDGEA